MVTGPVAADARQQDARQENAEHDLTERCAGAALSSVAPPEPEEIETPSGKGAGDENFPVGSILISKALRPTVARFYAFARAADDIADNGALSPEDKVARLNAFEAALMGARETPEKAARLGPALAAAGVPDQHARDLLAAFRQDAVKSRYANWAELIAYCELSANPVGRFLLDLHGESLDAWPAADALCTLLQINNHLQDLADDRRDYDRVYLPLDWMAAAGVGVEALDAPASAPALRQVIDRALDQCEALLEQARPLPGLLRSRRLAAESEVIWRLARRLIAKLRMGDPLAERVALNKADFAAASLRGMATLARFGGGAPRREARPAAAGSGTARPRLEDLAPRFERVDAKAAARAIVERSGTSFSGGMRILAKPRREAMWAIYAFCRIVDDIADGDFAPAAGKAEKRAALDAWAAEIERLYAGRPVSAVGRALLEPIERYALPKQEFLLMIDGMAMDAEGPIVAPTNERLAAYTRRVAGSVGLLSMRIFGAWRGDPSERFALALADALQFTNILRDVEEDAAIGRLYLPREKLVRAGLPPDDPAAVARHPNLALVCADLGERAAERFEAARREIPAHDRRRLAPALMMMGVYEGYLERLRARDWRREGGQVRMSKREKIWLGLRRVARPFGGRRALPIVEAET